MKSCLLALSVVFTQTAHASNNILLIIADAFGTDASAEGGGVHAIKGFCGE